MPLDLQPLDEAQTPLDLQPMSEADFVKARQQSATQEPAFKKLSGAVIPTVAGAAGMIPGVGNVAGATIQAGGTALNQLAGQEPFNASEIAKSGALGLLAPLLMKGIVNGAKGAYQAVGEFVNPGLARKMGGEAAAETLGAVPNTIDRAYSTKASKALYDQLSNQGGVPVTNINASLNAAANHLDSFANPSTIGNQSAGDYVRNIANKYTQGWQGRAVQYKDVTEEMQRLRRAAETASTKGDHLVADDLYAARAKVLEELDKVSPVIKQANDAYRREQAVEKIAKQLSRPQADVKLADLLAQDPLTRGVIDVSEAKSVEKIAEQIAKLGATGAPYSGVTAKVVSALSKPVAALFATQPGRTLLRKTYESGPIDATKLAMLAQFGRAYSAQEKSRADQGN